MKPEHEYWYPVHNAKGADVDEPVESVHVAAVQLVMEAAGLLDVELDEVAALAVVEVWREAAQSKPQPFVQPGFNDLEASVAAAVATYADNPPAVGAPRNWRWGYLPCGCRNDGHGNHVR